jgi:hypothetical protein
METSTYIKIALPVTLALGGLSILIAMAAVLMFYADWVGQSQLQIIPQPPHFAESVASIQDMASLKSSCRVLAQSLDNNICVLRDQSSLIQKLVHGIAWFVLAWGVVSGIVLLYVHFLLRRVAKKHEL